jgi:hypothetical protein
LPPGSKASILGTMIVLLEILKYTLPSAIMLVAVYFVITRFFQHEISKLEEARRGAQSRESFPVRMQAYERIILLLERISPHQLIMRLSPSGISLTQYQGLLTGTIRDEFDHNLSQQVYISSKAWVFVKMAREEMIMLINTAAGSIGPEASPAELAGKILELHSNLENDPLNKAIEFIKEEARRLL